LPEFALASPDGRIGLKKTVLQLILALPKKLFFTVLKTVKNNAKMAIKI
jgi:hypothetical protein